MIYDIMIPTCKKEKEIENLIKEIDNNTQEEHRIIASCQDLSAAINRNLCLHFAESEIMIFVDDDITDFYNGWLKDLVTPMIGNDKIMIISARLKNPDGNRQMGAYHMDGDMDVFTADNDRTTTACVAIRKNPIRFNEDFLGSGYEDTAYCQMIKRKYEVGRIWVTNKCQLTHLNEMKGQGKHWQHNHDLYVKLFPEDEAVKGQKDWTK